MNYQLRGVKAERQVLNRLISCLILGEGQIAGKRDPERGLWQEKGLAHQVGYQPRVDLGEGQILMGHQTRRATGTVRQNLACHDAEGVTKRPGKKPSNAKNAREASMITIQVRHERPARRSTSSKDHGAVHTAD